MPIELQIDGPDQFECNPSSLSTIPVSLVNVDAEHLTIGVIQVASLWQEWGRPPGWSVEIKDSRNQFIDLKPVNRFDNGSGGQIDVYRYLAPGETLTMPLKLGEYYDALPPGEYTLTVHFHNVPNYSNMTDPEHTIYISSRPIRLIVREEETKTGPAQN